MNKKKLQAIINLLLVIGIAIFVNVIANFFYGQVDLTEEKRFTLTEPTKQLLNDLDDVVYVQVLFGGEFPAGIKRLQNEVEEMLEDFRGVTGLIEYEFVNPYDGDTETVNGRVEELGKDGIVPVNLRIVDVDGTKEVFGYPYAIFNYGGRAFPVDFLENTPGVSPDENINNSVRLLEYKFAQAVSKVQEDPNKRPNILVTRGHGELIKEQTLDLERTLEQFYNVDTINLTTVTNLPAAEVALLVVAKPRAPFSEREKFVIDQYVMNGGKVMWLVDKMNAGLDSMRRQDYIPQEYPLNLEDMWFKYGFRVNSDLVLDLENTKIPQVVDAQGSMDLFPWFYHLKATPRSEHPIVKGLNPINLFFPSSIDTVRTKTRVDKTVLLTSSDYTRLQLPPVRLNFEILRYDPDPSKFNKGRLPLAVLLEGQFPSLYENRVTEGMAATLNEIGLQPKYVSEPTRMLVVSDGDVIKNWPRSRSGQLPPLGLNIYERQLYANKPFLVNAVEYLLDDAGVIAARSKEVKLRLLDTVRARSEAGLWRTLNLALPLVFLVLFGFGFNWWRKRKYAK
ncbi:MAG: gliding motility-associated ABC transporter substrate-binding protein GldG [Saprospiraceae bacterium]